MFLRRTERKKNGKAHSYWNVVENKRLDDGRVVQRHLLYLGEINSSQALAWRKAIEVFDEDTGRSRTLALFAAGPRPSRPRWRSLAPGSDRPAAVRPAAQRRTAVDDFFASARNAATSLQGKKAGLAVAGRRSRRSRPSGLIHPFEVA